MTKSNKLKILPNYLSEIAVDVKQRNTTVEFELQCSCGTSKFEIFRKKETKAE